MERKMNNPLLSTGILTVVGFLILCAGAVFVPINRFAIGIVQILGGFALYFYAATRLAKRNWLDIRAVFAGVWICTTGLAALRLTDYQEQWQTATWILIAGAYAVFQIGAALGIHAGPKLFVSLRCKLSSTGKLQLKLKENRLFWVCVISTFIGLACFLVNAAIKGFIPCFSDDVSAYVNFYTKFHVFAVASTGAAGLCYYTLATQKLSKTRRIILGICLFYLVIAFPILVLSRGVFITASLSLTVSIFYLHKKRFWVLLLCLASILGIYTVMSDLRGYSDTQLDNFFEPSDIVIVAPPASTEPDEVPDEQPQEEITFSLPPKVAFVYTYLTVSHDNFNEAVQNATQFAHGTKQLTPFNVILRSQWVRDKAGSVPVYLVREHLNTTNLIGDFYYDFAGFGVIACMLLWAFIFGLIQSMYTHGNGPFAMLALGNTMTPVACCFFSSWLSTFTHWMLWGVALLLALFTCISFSRKGNE